MEKQSNLDRTKRRGEYKISNKIAHLLPPNFNAIFVVVFTWDSMIPPWPAHSEVNVSIMRKTRCKFFSNTA